MSFEPGVYYMLDEHGEPVITRDLFEWGRWMEAGNKRVAEDVVDGRLWVSTVFLGLDHNYSEHGPPILWETMVFMHNGWQPSVAGVVSFDDIYQDRYNSRARALKGHRRAVAVAMRRLQEYDAKVSHM